MGTLKFTFINGRKAFKNKCLKTMIFVLNKPLKTMFHKQTSPSIVSLETDPEVTQNSGSSHGISYWSIASTCPKTSQPVDIVLGY